MKNNPKDISFNEIDSLLSWHGCTRRQPRSGSSHYFYTHPAISGTLTIPYARPIKAIYVKKALKMIEEIKEALTNE